jgi:hypothetical protein
VSRGARFSQADLTRAIKAFEKAGLCVARARVSPDGSIEVVAGSPEAQDNGKWFAGSPLYRDVA